MANAASNPDRWRPENDGRLSAGIDRSRSRKRRLFMLTALLLSLIAVIVVWMSLPSRLREPEFFVIWIDQYQKPEIPLIAWADQDRDAIQSLTKVTSVPTQQLDRLNSALRKISKCKETMVIFLCAHVALRSDGVVCLLPADADLVHELHWLKLSEFLDSVRKAPSPNKLIVADLMRPMYSPRGGILANDLGQIIQDEFQKVVNEDQSLRVLLACEPGEQSLVSGALGNSVFVHYVVHGLRGEADGYNKSDHHDSRVSADELGNFVRARVYRWSKENRPVSQTPKYLSSAAIDFDLSGVRPEAPEKAEKKLVYPKWLKDNWGQYLDWHALMPGQVPLKLVHSLGDRLLESERRLLAGHPAGEIQQNLEKTLSDLRGELRLSAREKRPSAARIAAGRIEELPEDAKKEIGDVFRLSLDPKKEPEADALIKSLHKKFADKQVPLAWHVLEILINQIPPTAINARVAFRLAEPAANYAEIAALKRIVQGLPRDPKKWPTDLVRDLLELAKIAEQAEQRADELNLDWIRPLLDESRELRRKADQIAGNYNEKSDNKKTVQKAIRSFTELKPGLDRLKASYQTYARGAIAIPALADYYDRTGGDLGEWAATAPAINQLRSVLAVAEESKSAEKAKECIEKIGEEAHKFRGIIEKPARPAEKSEYETLIGPSYRPQLVDFAKMAALLSFPQIPLEDRELLWGQLYKTEKQFAAATLNKDAEDNKAQRQTPSPPLEKNALLAGLHRKMLRRARTERLLLELRGYAPLHDALGKHIDAMDSSSNQEQWLSLRRQLRTAWTLIATK